MSGNRKLAGLLALLLVGWGAARLVVATGGRASARDPEAGSARADPEAGSGPGPAEPLGDAPGAGARVPEGSALAQAAPATDATDAAAPGGPGALSIEVEDTGQQALEGIRLFVTLDDEEGRRELRFGELHQGDRSTSVVTNFLGRATCFVPSGRAGALHAWSDAGGLEPRALAFGALAPFEDRSLRVVLRRGLDAAIERTVVDAVSGAPVPGALVRVREEARTLGGTRTDEQGAFRVSWDSWREVHLRIDARGYSPALVSLKHDAVPEPIPLWRRASLEFRATTANGAPLGRVWLELHGRLAEALPPPLRTPGLLAEKLAEAQAESWRQRTDASRRRRPAQARQGGFDSITDAFGDASFEELPAGVPLTMELLWDSGAGRSRLRIAPLQPGETREVLWSLPAEGAGQVVRGRLVDQDGAPVAGQGVWLVAAEEDRGEGYLGCGEPAYQGTTEEDGSFVIEAVALGRYLLGPAPECRFGYASENQNAVAPWASIVELVEGEEPRALLLQRPRELYVTCAVVDQHGDPRPADVSAVQRNSALTDAFLGEPLRLGPLMDGTHRISAIGHDSTARSAARNALPTRGGGEPLELVLLPEGEEVLGSVSGLVADAESGATLVVEVHAITAERAAASLDAGPWYVRIDGSSPRWDEWRSAACDGMGRFTIDGLEPGAYLLLAQAGSALGLARAFVPGSGDRVQDVLLRVPRPTSLVITGASYRGSYVALLEGLSIARGEWIRDEPFLVPSGRLALEIDDEGLVYRTLDAPPGGTLAIDLGQETR